MPAPDAIHDVCAINLSATSENKIHDDAIARTYGFTGALVPGVEVYAYMTHAPVARWGRAWLESGTAECRFVAPVYDGDRARVDEQRGPEGYRLFVACGERLCATGSATEPGTAPAPLVRHGSHRPPPVKALRPPASEASLAVGAVLSTAAWQPTVADCDTYLSGIGETDPLYRVEGLVHPGQILRLANRALVDNVVLGPWVHVGSAIAHHGVARIGETLNLDARVTVNDIRKGHGFVVFEALVRADNVRPISSITHTAIWRLRR